MKQIECIDEKFDKAKSLYRRQQLITILRNAERAMNRLREG